MAPPEQGRHPRLGENALADSAQSVMTRLASTWWNPAIFAQYRLPIS